MRFAFSLMLIFSSAAWAESGNLQPIGYLEAFYTTAGPLSGQGGSVVNAHLRNVSDAPVLLNLSGLNFQPAFINMGLPEKEFDPEMDYGVWGPVVDLLSYERKCLSVSGFGGNGEIPLWPARDGITLLRGEGYARKITFKAGWIGDAEIPAGTKYLAIDSSPVISVATPVLKPEAVQPGKPVIFDAPNKVYAPGCRSIPFTMSGKATKAADKPGFDDLSGISLEVEAPMDAREGADVEITYLVGNSGTKTVWIEQSSLVPSKVSCEVFTMGKKLAAFDGSDMEILNTLMPSREPVALNPGEFLTFKRVFLADSLKMRRGLDYGFMLSFSPAWYPSSITDPENRQESKLEASTVFRLK